jgi:hypothetical protein
MPAAKVISLMREKKKSDNLLVICLLIIGTILTIIVPLMLPLLPLAHLKNYGSVGDAFGGIANPIAQIVGFILLYLALRAQIKANSILQTQVNAENNKEMQRRSVTLIHELYTFLENNINTYSYEAKFDGSDGMQVLHGRRAIRCFIDDIEDMNIDLHNAEQLLQKDGVREILSILRIAENTLERIKHADIDENDKLFYIDLMKHELTFSIFPYTDLDESANLKLPVCDECHEPHGNYPPLIFDKLQELKRHFHNQ